MKRTQEVTREIYNKVWGEHYARLKKYQEDNVSLFEAMGRLLKVTREYEHLIRPERDMFEDSHPFKRSIPTDGNGLPYHIVVTSMDHLQVMPCFVLSPTILLDSIKAQCTPKTRKIIELGAGRGTNLAYIYCYLKELFPDIEYVAAEWSDAGQDCCRELAKLDDNFQMKSVHFNFYEPTYDFIEKDENVIVFSSHAIEQIPILPASVHNRILDITRNVTFMHLEPIGWQYDKEAVAYSKAVYAQERNIHKGFKHIIGKKFDPIWMATYCYQKDHNRNLKFLIDDLVAEGKVEIDSFVLNEWGLNAVNPGTRIVMKAK
jgi:hypothetical protein